MIYDLYYPVYDIGVNSETGEIKLPICKCKENDMCIFLRNWIEDGKPTHLKPEELEILKSKQS
jgi:hypothetical protein